MQLMIHPQFLQNVQLSQPSLLQHKQLNKIEDLSLIKGQLINYQQQKQIKVQNEVEYYGQDSISCISPVLSSYSTNQSSFSNIPQQNLIQKKQQQFKSINLSSNVYNTFQLQQIKNDQKEKPNNQKLNNKIINGSKNPVEQKLENKFNDIITKRVKLEENCNNEQKQQCSYKSLASKHPLVLSSKNTNKLNYKQYMKFMEQQQNLIQEQLQGENFQSKPITCVLNLRENVLSCPYENCDFSTLSKSSLISHKRNTHQLTEFFCNVENCDFSTKNKVCLVQHMKNKHCDKQFYCKECSFEAKNQNILNNHMKNVHCDNNKNKFNEIQSLKNQQLLQEKQIQQQCCEFKQEESQELIDSNSLEEKVYKCEHQDCKFETKSRKSYYHHRMNYHSKECFKCPEPGCQFTAKNKVIIYNHRKNIHEKEVTICKIDSCYFKAKNWRSLQNHLKNKHQIHNLQKQKEILEKYKEDQQKILALQEQKKLQKGC